jgi:hypothetical protein
MKSGRRGNLNESIGIASVFALAMTILVRLLRCARNDSLKVLLTTKGKGDKLDLAVDAIDC